MGWRAQSDSYKKTNISEGKKVFRPFINLNRAVINTLEQMSK